ncbi:MAG: hypothetical protein ABIK15_09360 [Pseudomonadota bacterium]
MNSITAFLTFLDPWLIAPFRWLPSASAGYLLGTAVLAFQCFLLGNMSMVTVQFLNRNYLGTLRKKMDHHHQLSEKALMMGDKESYKAVNKQALDAFGHSFSMGGAVFCVSIWPMPFALAWMHLRFADVPLELSVSLPLMGNTIHYFASFLSIYIAVRIMSATTLNRIPAYSRLTARLTGRAEPIH